MQGSKEFVPKTFYTISLPDMVPDDNFYRQLDRELDLTWVRRETARFYSHEGRPAIAPDVFIKILIIGYLNNIGSDRRLMETCANRLDLRLFLRYDIDEALPCHSTLSRTRALWGEEVFGELFTRVLGMCVQKGMVRGKRQAMDSAPVKANASMDSLKEKEVTTDAIDYANELDSGSEYKVDQYKKKRVEAHHAWKEKTYATMPGHRDTPIEDENGNLIRPKFLSNHTHYSPSDPDARISVKPGKARQLNYHSQLAVDDGHHVITGALASHADLRDSQVLPQLLDQTMNNLAQHSITPEEISADAGYSSGDALKHCDQRGITAYIPNFGQYKAEREGFQYNAELNQYECRQGNRAILHYKRTEANHDGHYMHKYRSSSKDCRQCPLRSTCIGKSDFKTITHSVDKQYYDAMHQRMQTKYAKKIMKKRSSTVEPVLGTLINFLNLKRIYTRGIRNANKHVLMAAACYNLKKYMKFTRPMGEVCTSVMEIAKIAAKRAQNRPIFLFPITQCTITLTNRWYA